MAEPYPVDMENTGGPMGLTQFWHCLTIQLGAES